MAQAAEKGQNADIILLGPQVRFNLDKVKQMHPGKPVEAIDMSKQSPGTTKEQVMKRQKIAGSIILLMSLVCAVALLTFIFNNRK